MARYLKFSLLFNELELKLDYEPVFPNDQYGKASSECIELKGSLAKFAPP